MADSDMEISSDSESVKKGKPRDGFISSGATANIPMSASDNPCSSNTTARSASDNPNVTAMPLKKRWRQSLEQEPKKKKVSLEAYRQRRASGGDSGDSLLSTSGTDSASTSAQLKENVKQEHKLARELAQQKLSIAELERRKAKLKKALKQIDAAAAEEGSSSGPNAAAKNEFDKFTEKQSRWLEKRAREKRRDVNVDSFEDGLEAEPSSDRHIEPRLKRSDQKQREIKHKRSHERHDMTHRHRRTDAVANGSESRTKRAVHKQQVHDRGSRKHRHKSSVQFAKEGASPAKRSRPDFTSTLDCLKKAQEAVQRQLDLLRSPIGANSTSGQGTNGFRSSTPRSSKAIANSPKQSSTAK